MENTFLQYLRDTKKFKLNKIGCGILFMSGSYHSGKTHLSYGEGADEEASRTMFGESKPLKFSFLSGSNATALLIFHIF